MHENRKLKPLLYCNSKLPSFRTECKQCCICLLNECTSFQRRLTIRGCNVNLPTDFFPPNKILRLPLIHYPHWFSVLLLSLQTSHRSPQNKTVRMPQLVLSYENHHSGSLIRINMLVQAEKFFLYQKRNELHCDASFSEDRVKAPSHCSKVRCRRVERG